MIWTGRQVEEDRSGCRWWKTVKVESRNLLADMGKGREEVTSGTRKSRSKGDVGKTGDMSRGNRQGSQGSRARKEMD